MRTKGFCSALLRCGEIKLIAEKREYAILDLIANIATCCKGRLAVIVIIVIVGVLRPARFSEKFSSTDTLKSS